MENTPTYIICICVNAILIRRRRRWKVHLLLIKKSRFLDQSVHEEREKQICTDSVTRVKLPWHFSSFFFLLQERQRVPPSSVRGEILLIAFPSHWRSMQTRVIKVLFASMYKTRVPDSERIVKRA